MTIVTSAAALIEEAKQVNELSNIQFGEPYIKGKCTRILGVPEDKVRITFIDEGVLNYVYKADTPKGAVFIKQALEVAKYADHIGPDLAQLGYDRISIEMQVIEMLRQRCPANVHLPKIIDYDQENNILILSDVSGGQGELLENALLTRPFKKTTAVQLASFLGIIHAYTHNRDNWVHGSRQEDLCHWELFLHLRTIGIDHRHISRRTSRILHEFCKDILKEYTQDMLILVDCCPKNILEREDGTIGVIDFDVATGVGDSAYDLGFLSGHYFISAIIQETPEQAKMIADTLLESYGMVSGFDVAPMVRRVLVYAGATMLYRLHGASRARYIPKNKKELVQKIGEDLVINQVKTTDEVISILGQRE